MTVQTTKRIRKSDTSTVVLKLIVVLLGLGVAVLCGIMPILVAQDIKTHPETADLIRAFAVGVYAVSAVFIAALFQAYALLGFIDKNKVFSERAVRSLKIISQCASVIAGIIGIELGIFILFFRNKNEDIAGIIMLALILIVGCLVVAATAAVFARLLKTATEIKTEQDLTI